MANINDYGNDATLTGADKLLGTDAVDGSTKNFTLTGIEAFLATNGALLDIATYDPAGIAEQVVGLVAAQTITNKTIDADNNTISNLAHGAEVDNPSSGVHGVTGSVVGTTDAQTITNKTMDFSSGGTNTLTADAGDVIYDNSTSGLVATDVNAAIDEVEGRLDTAETDITNLEDRVISYDTTNEATVSYAIKATDQFTIQAAGAGASMSRSLTTAVLGAMDANAKFAIQNTDGNTLEVNFTGVALYGHAAGNLSIDGQGSLVWFQKIDATNVAAWGDFTITP